MKAWHGEEAPFVVAVSEEDGHISVDGQLVLTGKGETVEVLSRSCGWALCRFADGYQTEVNDRPAYLKINRSGGRS